MKQLIEINMGVANLKYSDSFASRFDSALILEVTRGNTCFTSSSVAIGRNMLLTTAHSVDCLESGKVVLGNIYSQEARSIKIKNIIVHPEYNPGKSLYENDIAIVILDSNLPSWITIEPLECDINLYNGEVLERFGFGGRDNLNMRTWMRPVFEMSTFTQKNFILKDRKSVVGDSGGPIYKNVGGTYKLVGIHSTLEGSDKTYIVNVMKYLSWIDSNRSLRVVS